jgi:hypothetical protein
MLAAVSTPGSLHVVLRLTGLFCIVVGANGAGPDASNDGRPLPLPSFATDSDGASRLRGEPTRLFQEHNLATDGATALAGEYLDVQARVA